MALAAVWSAVRAVADGYVAMADIAISEIRARDVLSTKPPLVGLYSTALSFADPVFHPGPLVLTLMAIPARLGRHGAGLALGAGLLNAAVAVAIPWTASKFLGRRGADVVAAITAIFVWSLGSEVLYDLFLSSIAMLPFLLLLVAAWGWASGDDRLAVVVVVAYSLAGQAHGSAFVVGSGVLVGAAVVRLLGRRISALRSRPLAIAGSLLVVLWILPVIQQLFGSGPGNVTQMLRVASQDDRAALGLQTAMRLSASVLVAPPWWTRAGFTAQIPEASKIDLVSIDELGSWTTVASVAALVALAVVVAGAATWLRHRDAVAVPGAVVVGVAASWGVVSTSRVPVDELLGVMVHTVRWLWPLGAFVTMYLAVSLRRLLAERHRPALTWQLVGVGGLAVLATFPAHSHAVGPNGRLQPLHDVGAEIRDAMGELERRGVVFVDIDDTLFDPFADTILAELRARDIPFVIDEPYRIVQLGEHRRFDGDADVRLWIDYGPFGPLSESSEVVATFRGVTLEPRRSSSPQWQESDVWQEFDLRVVVEPIPAA